MNEKAFFKFLFKIYVKEVSEKLSKLRGDDAIRFLEMSVIVSSPFRS